MDVDLVLQVLKTLLVVTILCEGLTESIKLIYPGLADNQKQAISFGFGILICICIGSSLFTGSLVIRLIGAVLAGILAGRGSNYIHSLIEMFGGAAGLVKAKSAIAKIQVKDM